MTNRGGAPAPGRPADASARRLRRAPTRPAGGSERKARMAAILLIAGGVAAALLGLVNESPWLMSLSAGLVSLGLAAVDFAAVRERGVTPITVYALGMGVAALANVVGLLAANASARDRYFLYSSEPHLFLASLLMLAGSVLPVLGFWTLAPGGETPRAVRALPMLVARVSDRHLVPWGTGLALAAMAFRHLVRGSPLGTVTDLVFALPMLIIFVLARSGAARRVPWAMTAALLLAFAAAAYALRFAYLRIEIVAPLAAFVAGALAGARSWSALRSAHLLPVYAAGIVFALYFGALAETRGQYTSTAERLRATYRLRSIMAATPTRPQQTVLSRLTTFNQLSQIGRVVDEDGFLDGGTLEYLAYAFIPRFIWRSKPIISKGAWFATRIGQGWVTPDGRATNAVNMTIPGELYLNFGWPGVLLGGWLFGAILAVLWLRTGFWAGSDNVLGSAYGFFMLWAAATLVGDLAVIVTLIALYLLFVAIGAMLRALDLAVDPAVTGGRRVRQPSPPRTGYA